MNNAKIIEWLLRVGLFGLFIGHGIPALEGNQQWVGWIMAFGGWDTGLATQLLFAVGILDVVVAFILLLRPVRAVLFWAIVWTTWTAVMRVLPFIGEDVWEFVERWINIAAPLALMLMLGWPKNWKEWLR